MPGIPFVGSLYDYSRGPGANISNLLLERGRAQADSAARIGQIWGNTVASLGQLPRQMQEDKLAQQRLANETAITEARKQELEQHAREREQDIKAQAAKQQAEQVLFTKIHSGEPVKVEDFYQTYGKDGFAAYKSYQEAQSPKPDARTLLTGLGMASDEYLQHSWPVLQPQISKALGVPPEAIPQWDRAKYNEFMQAQGWAKPPKEEKKYKVDVPGPGGTKIEKLVTEDELAKGVQGYRPPVQPSAPSYQSKEVLGDDGKPTTANFNARTGKYTDPAGNEIKNPKPIPSASEAKDEAKFKTAAPVLDAVSELSEKINTLNGVIAKASGEAEKAKAKINLNDDIAEYQALVEGFTPLVARALGHTGVLTQQDVDSVKMLFPKPGDSKSLRDRKVKRVKSILGQLNGSAEKPPQPPPGFELIDESGGEDE